jgi:hypothetical protein
LKEHPINRSPKLRADLRVHRRRPDERVHNITALAVLCKCDSPKARPHGSLGGDSRSIVKGHLRGALGVVNATAQPFFLIEPQDCLRLDKDTWPMHQLDAAAPDRPSEGRSASRQTSRSAQTWQAEFQIVVLFEQCEHLIGLVEIEAGDRESEPATVRVS